MFRKVNSHPRGMAQNRNVPSRSGVATVWMLAAIPVVVLLLMIVVDIGHVWVARVELENGLEAAALAAVKEWASAGASGPNWTVPARNRGMELAGANAIRDVPLVIASNLGTFNAGFNPNENRFCDPVFLPPNGNLVFGSIDEGPPTVFDASKAPSCGTGRVLFDASGLNLQTAANNEWGIAFQKTNPPAPPALRITKIEINLQANNPGPVFSGVPTLSDNIPPHAVHDSSSAQPDIVGFSNPGAQIQFVVAPAHFLTINFSADGGNDDGFAPGDRFRFGLGAEDGGTLSGDEIGDLDVGVTVYFNNGNISTGIFGDTNERKNQCHDPRLIDPVTGTFVVISPTNIPDVPCPPNSSVVKNGQSYVLISPTSTQKFGVHAQAIVSVNSLFLSTFGADFGTYRISCGTTALHDCQTDTTRLVRIDQFICGPGNGADP